MKRILITLTIVIIIGILYSQNNIEDSPTKIGIMTVMTGDIGFLGENIVRSAELAKIELGREELEFVIADVGGLRDQAETISALRKMVEVDKVEYIINGMLSNGTMAVAPLLDELEVVMVTPLTGGENIDNAAKYLFRNGPSDIIAGTKPASDIYNKFHYKTVSLLTDNAEYTLDIAKHFRNSYQGEITGDHIIIPSETDYRTQLLKVREENPDALFINTADGVSSRFLIKQSRELGIEVPIFANFLAYGPQLIEFAGTASEGVYVYDPEFNESDPRVQSFLAKYLDKYGVDSPIRFHTTGTHDALKMGLEAIDKVGNSGPAIRNYLLGNIQNWDGYNGRVSFDPKGNTQTGFVLKQIQNGELVTVD